MAAIIGAAEECKVDSGGVHEFSNDYPDSRSGPGTSHGDEHADQRTEQAQLAGLAMARQKVIVKRLNAIQNFGAMDVLCTDKTGTLTQGKIVLEKHLDAHGDPSEKVLQYGYLNSYHHTGLKNLLDEAILAHEELVDPVSPELGQLATHHLFGNHRHCGRLADGFTPGRRARVCPASIPVLVAPGDHPGLLRGPDPGGEELVLPQVWRMMAVPVVEEGTNES